MRNVRRLQLVFLNLIYEHIQLDMHHTASEPTSKPVQPLEAYSRCFGEMALARGASPSLPAGGGWLSMERVKRIELSYEAWEAAVLPLNYTRIAARILLDGAVAIRPHWHDEIDMTVD